jgi:alkylation response protein AidB-like acyl-CoA dehydrogenase
LAWGQGLGTQTIDNTRRLELLRRSAQGKWIGAIALSEPTAGSDLAAVQTRAIRQDGYWLLSGTKRWAGFALAADFIEVLARTREPKDGEPRSAGLENISRSQTATHLPRRDDRARQNWLSRLSHLAP